MAAYYSDNDPFAVAWLRELIKKGLIADGEVDERSIEDVQPDDLRGFKQCHFFAGIGGWSYALRLAGWPDDRPVWTGSCPCQPWSVAGEDKGYGDERHLWPSFSRLIRERKPSEVFGEQVAGAISWGWLDDAFVDLEAQGYACGSAVLRADAFGANHERKRVFYVAHTSGEGRQRFVSNNGISRGTSKTLSVDGNALIRARDALAGDYGDLLPCNGLSVQVERNALKGYGNAIVPQVAAEFIKAYLGVITV